MPIGSRGTGAGNRLNGARRRPRLSNTDTIETRAATRLVALFTAIGLGVYLAMAAVVTPDALLTQQGTTEQVHFALRAAHALDRDAELGDQPVVWLLGSSIVREAFDAEALDVLLPHQAVRKYAFNRGGPIFVWSFLDEIDLRPGDIVVTAVHPDHFRADWLAYHNKPTVYLNTLMDADELLQIEELPLADRLDFAVTSVPPRDFWRYREAYASAASGWLLHTTLGTRAPRVRTKHREDPFQTLEKTPKFDTIERLQRRNRLNDADMVLAPGQTNYDGVHRLIAQVEGAGATAMLVYLPNNPLYYERMVSPQTMTRFHDHFAADPHYSRLSELPEDHFLDYKHVNFRGRDVLTQQLATLLSKED